MKRWLALGLPVLGVACVLGPEQVEQKPRYSSAGHFRLEAAVLTASPMPDGGRAIDARGQVRLRAGSITLTADELRVEIDDGGRWGATADEMQIVR